MKLGAVKRFLESEAKDSPDWFRDYLKKSNEFSAQVLQTLQGNVSITDNTNCSFGEYVLNHATESIVEAPTSGTPRGAIAVAAFLQSNNKTISRPVDVSVAMRQIDRTKVGLTANFPCPLRTISLKASSTQSIGSAGSVKLALGTELYNVGDSESALGGKYFTYETVGVGTEIIAPDPGSYMVQSYGSLSFSTATNVYAQHFLEAVSPTTGAERLSVDASAKGNVITDTYQATCSSPHYTSESGVRFRCYMYHQDGFTEATVGGDNLPHLKVRMTDRHTSFKALVRVLFLGA